MCSMSAGRSCWRVRGLQLGTGASERTNRDRVLNERLLTVEWKQRAAAGCGSRRPKNVLADQYFRQRPTSWRRD